jgi:hypothetical protein
MPAVQVAMLSRRYGPKPLRDSMVRARALRKASVVQPGYMTDGIPAQRL